MKRKRTLVRLLILCCVFLLAFTSLASESTYAVEGKFNMSYIYFGNSDAYTSHVELTKNSLNEISPNYFNLKEDGTLELTPAVDTDFIKEMHAMGVKVVPFLSNHWDRDSGRQALINRETLSRQIAEAVREYNLDGVNVDIENMTEVDRDNYTDFVKLLREELGSGKKLAVAVAPNPFHALKGWQGSYDYKSLGKYADYLMIMAYDEHYQGGPAGPVSSASFVEKSIRYALEYVSNDKIVLGIPFYGRYWENGSNTGGYGISLTVAEELIKKYRGQVVYDNTAQSAKAVITVKSTDEKPYVFGKTLDAGTYTIWYENEQSIKYKLKLVQKYNLKGSGSWSLGQETQNTWDYYKLWLNGYYFEDAQGHWAQEYILSMAVREWMKGVSSTRFSPENQLTRAEAAVILVRAFGLEDTGGASAFKDISGHWAEKEINIAAQYKIVQGKGNGRFEPDKPVTRQEIAVMLDRVLTQSESEENAGSQFRDVNPSANPWSYDAIIRMAQSGIITGRPDGYFHPKASTNRAEMAALMDRAAGYIESSTAFSGEGVIGSR